MANVNRHPDRETQINAIKELIVLSYWTSVNLFRNLNTVIIDMKFRLNILNYRLLVSNNIYFPFFSTRVIKINVEHWLISLKWEFVVLNYIKSMKRNTHISVFVLLVAYVIIWLFISASACLCCLNFFLFFYLFVSLLSFLYFYLYAYFPSSLVKMCVF